MDQRLHHLPNFDVIRGSPHSRDTTHVRSLSVAVQQGLLSKAIASDVFGLLALLVHLVTQNLHPLVIKDADERSKNGKDFRLISGRNHRSGEIRRKEQTSVADVRPLQGLAASSTWIVRLVGSISRWNIFQGRRLSAAPRTQKNQRFAVIHVER